MSPHKAERADFWLTATAAGRGEEGVQERGVTLLAPTALPPPHLHLALGLCYITMMELGGKVRQMRRSQGLSLEQLAEVAGLNANYVLSIEEGKLDPGLSTITALAKGLRVPPSALFDPLPALSGAASEAALLLEGLGWKPPPGGPPFGGPPPRSAAGARMPVPMEPHRSPLPTVVWKTKSVA
jgi:transcriptional regulator with XRE-family HTH domain